jgi:pimeloyl-ACP methyl ester carboxylesterase
MAILSKQVTRAVFGQAGRLFPAFTGRLAFELFCRTADPRKLSKGERASMERSAPLMARAVPHRLKTPHGSIAVHEFPAQTTGDTCILVIHGWRSRTDFMAPMIASLAADGYRVIGIDLPGHGQSSGRSLNVRLGVAAVEAAYRHFGRFDVIVGHSFGGVVAVNAVTGSIKGHDPVPCDRLAIISSPNSMPQLFDAFGRYIGLPPRANEAMAKHVRKVAGHPISTYVMKEQLKRLGRAVLVMHAPDDREVAFADAEAMAAAGPHVTLQPMPGLGHRRIIADTRVFAALHDFCAMRALATQAT